MIAVKQRLPIAALASLVWLVCTGAPAAAQEPNKAPAPAQAPQAALPGPQPAPEITPTARVRETFAQFVPVEKKPEATAPKKRKVAKAAGQPMRVARYSYFGSSTW